MGTRETQEYKQDMEIDRLSKEELKVLCGELSSQVSMLTSKMEDIIREDAECKEEKERYYVSLMTWVVEHHEDLPHSMYEEAIDKIEAYIKQLGYTVGLAQSAGKDDGSLFCERVKLVSKQEQN